MVPASRRRHWASEIQNTVKVSERDTSDGGSERARDRYDAGGPYDHGAGYEATMTLNLQGSVRSNHDADTRYDCRLRRAIESGGDDGARFDSMPALGSILSLGPTPAL